MFFISDPHSSLSIPSILSDRINPHAQLREIAEPGIDTLFTWDGIPRIMATAHQAFPNLNRGRSDTNPRTGEKYPSQRSLFPLEDFHGNPIYKEGQELSSEEQEVLLQEHYDPFHTGIERLIESGSYDFFLDVHAMNGGCTSYDDARFNPEKRSNICLGNNGNEHGEQHEDGEHITFDPKTLCLFADVLREKGYTVELNEPFRGGYILQYYGQRFPCIQVEINKELYMDADDGEVNEEKILVLRDVLSTACMQL